MRIPRIYLPVPLRTGESVELDSRAARHVIKVLRLRPGDALVLFNGNGGEYRAVLEGGPRDAPRVHVGEHRYRSIESPLHLHLAQGISRGERMDYVVQKAVELGVSTITPLWTERCVVRLDAERGSRRLEHWRAVAIAAAEQCGRDRIPDIALPVPLVEWLSEPRDALHLVLDPLADQGLADFDPPVDKVCLMVGPEGGLSEAELTQARTSGCRSLRLGPRILRTETAAMAALTVLQAAWGDLGI